MPVVRIETRKFAFFVVCSKRSPTESSEAIKYPIRGKRSSKGHMSVSGFFNRAADRKP